MITLCTAVGKYSLKKNNDGMLYPSVTVNLQEKALGIDEMILWSTLLWNIMTVDELKDAYSKKAIARAWWSGCCRSHDRFCMYPSNWRRPRQRERRNYSRSVR